MSTGTPNPDRASRAELPTQMATPRHLPATIATASGHADATKLTLPPGEDLAGQVLGDFRLDRLLGRGGMGAVWAGVQISLDRPVAVKILPVHLAAKEGFRERFSLEAKAVGRINSPHVVQVYGAGTSPEGLHYFAMEYVEGADLGYRLKHGLRPNTREALDVVTQAARGLAAAGEHGVIHRDIKPGNMMITQRGQVKLMDFGLVRLASEAQSLTMTGTIMGTVTYFSPEQGRGLRCDQRTDLYALGIVFYELLTGALPFTGEDATSIIYQHIHVAPRPPKEIDPRISEDFQAVVLKCLQKDPDHRYRDANDLLADLERLAAGARPITAYRDPASLRSGATVIRSGEFAVERRKRAWLGGVIVALLAVVGLGAWWFSRSPPIVAAPTMLTPPAVATLPAGPRPADIDTLLAAGQLTEARRISQAQLRAHPDDLGWQTASSHVDQAQGMELVAQAEVALARNDLEAAGSAAAAAASLVGNQPRLKAVESTLAEREGVRRQRERTLAEAEALLSEGQTARAVEVLDRLAASATGDVAVAAAVRRAHLANQKAVDLARAVQEQLTQGDAAMRRKDHDAAQLAYTAAKQLDPVNAQASTGLAAVAAARTRTATLSEELAVAAKDPTRRAEAERLLTELRAHAPGSPQLAVAEGLLASARLTDDDAKRRKVEAEAEAEARTTADSRAVLAALGDLTQPLPTVERAVATFLTAHPTRPERDQFTRRLDDRRARAEVELLLIGLDAAVRSGSAAAIAAAVADPDYAQSLSELSNDSGLVFVSRLDDFARDGERATARLSIDHALATFPQRTLTCLADLVRDHGHWRISKVAVQPPSTP